MDNNTTNIGIIPKKGRPLKYKTEEERINNRKQQNINANQNYRKKQNDNINEVKQNLEKTNKLLEDYNQVLNTTILDILEGLKGSIVEFNKKDIFNKTLESLIESLKNQLNEKDIIIKQQSELLNFKDNRLDIANNTIKDLQEKLKLFEDDIVLLNSKLVEADEKIKSLKTVHFKEELLKDELKKEIRQEFDEEMKKELRTEILKELNQMTDQQLTFLLLPKTSLPVSGSKACPTDDLNKFKKS